MTTTTTTPAPINLGVMSQVNKCVNGITELHCDKSCEWIFDRLFIKPEIAGGTSVQWAMHPQFNGSPPLTFFLQVGRTGNPLADDWEWVAGPVVDTYSLVDPDKRLYGRYPFTHYRVVVQTADRSGWASKPEPIFGRLDRRDWLLLRETIRGEILRLQQGAGRDGHLLKRRIAGDACTCIDSQTGESRDPDCTDCYGTAFLGGYYEPLPCFWVEDVQNSGFRSYNSDKGTTNDGNVITGRCTNVPAIFSYDVWVEKNTGDRYYFHTIRPVVRIRGVDVVLQCEMKRAAYNDIIYQFPVD